MKRSGDTPVKPLGNAPMDYLVMGCYHEDPDTVHAQARLNDSQEGGDTPGMDDHG